MPNTPHGLPYPANTDFVKDGAAAIQALATAVDPLATSRPVVRVYHNAAQSIATGVQTPLAFNTEIYDDAGMHDPAVNPSRLVCGVAGTYYVQAGCEFVASAAGMRWMTLRRNGIAGEFQTIDRRPGHATIVVPLNVSVLLQLAVNDYVEAIVFQDSGAALVVEAGGAQFPFGCQMMLARIAP
jgi:hypothetical protein